MYYFYVILCTILCKKEYTSRTLADIFYNLIFTHLEHFHRQIIATTCSHEINVRIQAWRIAVRSSRYWKNGVGESARPSTGKIRVGVQLWRDIRLPSRFRTVLLVFNFVKAESLLWQFQAMGRILVGLCQVGAWGCFDEFNRLEERMLSAVSQQIQTIQASIQIQIRIHYVQQHVAKQSTTRIQKVDSWTVEREEVTFFESEVWICCRRRCAPVAKWQLILLASGWTWIRTLVSSSRWILATLEGRTCLTISNRWEDVHNPYALLVRLSSFSLIWQLFSCSEAWPWLNRIVSWSLRWCSSPKDSAPQRCSPTRSCHFSCEWTLFMDGTEKGSLHQIAIIFPACARSSCRLSVTTISVYVPWSMCSYRQEMWNATSSVKSEAPRCRMWRSSR